MQKLDIKKVNDGYVDFLRDESRIIGSADTISFPTTEKELSDTMRYLCEDSTNVTIQGQRTGLAAGAVPINGHIISLIKMNKVIKKRYDKKEDRVYFTLQPGVILKDFNTILKNTGYFFPPDPTEATASIGGMVSCNSSGSRSYRYGPVRNYVNSIRVILSDGSILALTRNIEKAEGTSFSVLTESKKILHGRLPLYKMPKTKNATGYYVLPNMDLIDLFIGSEGTLGIISEIELEVIRKAEYIWGMMLFFNDEISAIEYVNKLRMTKKLNPSAIEFFDFSSLQIAKDHFPVSTYSAAVYIEFEGDDESSQFDTAMSISNIAGGFGCGENDNILASTKEHMEKLRAMRHSVPEGINTLIDNIRTSGVEISKLGTDIAVPSLQLLSVMKMYRNDLDQNKLNSAIFGHIGDDHVHVNIIPNSINEYEIGKALHLKWIKQIVKQGGTFSAEHGVGKLKKTYLELMYGKEGINQMKALKTIFDPCNILNIGNMFDGS